MTAFSEPQFVNSDSGRLFVIVHHPKTSSAHKKVVLLLPPFAEEMNKSRRQITQQARYMADRGYAVVVFDFFGTGDSGGEFAEASIETWRRDCHALAKWLREQEYSSVVLWTIRFGSLMAQAFIEASDLKVSHLILCQPQLSGSVCLNQFLRLQTAANLLSKNSSHGSSVKEMQRTLEAGNSVEVAGYSLSAAMYGQARSLRLENLQPTIDTKIAWFNISPTQQAKPPAIAQKMITQWQQSGLSVSYQSIPGDGFWSTAELVVVPALNEVFDEFLHLGAGL